MLSSGTVRQAAWGRRLAWLAVLVGLYAVWQARNSAQEVRRFWGDLFSIHLMVGLSDPVATAFEQSNRLAEHAVVMARARRDLADLDAQLSKARSTLDMLEKQVIALEQARPR